MDVDDIKLTSKFYLKFQNNFNSDQVDFQTPKIEKKFSKRKSKFKTNSLAELKIQCEK